MAIDPTCLGNEASWKKLFHRVISAPCDAASLSAFRILFGVMMMAAMARFLAKGWVHELYVEPAFHFTYPGFGWVRPWPEPFMQAHFIALGLLAAGIALGCQYRICAFLFFVGFTYVELIDQTTYLNHYYLISLLSGLLVLLPAHRLWSLDARRSAVSQSNVVPAWVLNILRLQVGVVYFFAGLAKLNSDWLLQAQPLRIWLAARSDLPLLGPLLNEVWVAYAASWFGAVFDLTIVFFLLCGKTRKVAYLLVVFFHLATGILFNIGMFPWIMIVAATLFFLPEWPRQLLARCRIGICAWKMPANISGPPAGLATQARPLSWTRSFMGIGLSVYVLGQLLLPIRPFLTAEPAAWTSSNFNCAWQVMIVEKTGFAQFYACEAKNGRRWKLPLRPYITPRQEMMMAQDPYLIRGMARRLADDLHAQGIEAEIKVDAFATLNGRPSQRLIDPEVNLAGPLSAGWVLPFRER